MSQFSVDPAVKAKLLAERISTLNLEGYQHELNKETCLAIGDEAGATQAGESIAIILNAIELAQSQLTALETPSA